MNDEELETYIAYLQCSKKKIIRKSYIKYEVFKYILSKLVQYNLNKSYKYIWLGSHGSSSLCNIFFATGVFYQQKMK